MHRRVWLVIICIFLILPVFGQSLPNYVPTSGLMGWWPLDGNANDISGNGYNGTAYGVTSVSDRNGNSNSAYSFDITSTGWGSAKDRIVVTDDAVANAWYQANAFTISTWIKLDVKTGSFANRPHTILGIWDGNGTAVIRHQISPSNLQSTTLSSTTAGSTTISNNDWVHVVTSWDGDTLRHYQNGTAAGKSYLSYSIPSSTNYADITFGELHMGNGHWYHFVGSMDDMGIWNRALSQCEISNLYNSNFGSCAAGINTDTTICRGDTLTLGTSYSPASICANGIGEWEEILTSTDLAGYTITRNSSYSFDTTSGTYYSVNNGNIVALDLVNKTVSSISSTGGSSSISNAVYNYSDGKLYGHRVGRDVVYSISTSGGAWTSVGTGSFDGNSYSSLEFYNSHDERVGFFGGYGYFAVKNWIYESTASGWINSFLNNSNCNSLNIPSKRIAGGIAPNKNFTKMYVYSGMGNCSGSQTATSCTLGSAWATDVGVYCWLKDLWEYDFTNDQFTNILPYNHASIPLEGEFTYDYNRDIFYLLGGWTPSPTYQSGYGNTATNSNLVFRYDRGNNAAGFDTVNICGTPPPIGTINQTSGIGVFDSPRDRILWLRTDGVWAINLSNSSSTSSTSSFLWSTGDTTSTLSVSPSSTTKYWVRQIAGTDTIVDTTTVNVLNPAINASTNSICNPGDSLMLWISKDSSVTQSCGGMPASLQIGLI